MKEAFNYLALVVLALVFLIAAPLVYRGTAQDITISVTGKERISTGAGDKMRHKYLVFTEGETFENTDSLLFMKFNSSDFQRELDGTKSVTVAGWRIPFLSWYRNIVKINESH